MASSYDIYHKNSSASITPKLLKKLHFFKNKLLFYTNYQLNSHDKTKIVNMEL